MVCITAFSHGVKYDTHPLHIYGIKRAYRYVTRLFEFRDHIYRISGSSLIIPALLEQGYSAPRMHSAGVAFVAESMG